MNKYQEAFEDLCVIWDEEGMGKDHFKDQYPHLYNTIRELVDNKTSKKTKIWVESLEDVIIDLQRLKQLENKELEYIKEINKEIEIIKEIINYIKVGSEEDAKD